MDLIAPSGLTLGSDSNRPFPHEPLLGIARPANQPVAAPATLPTHSDQGETAIPNILGTRINPAAIVASTISGIARPAPQRPAQ
jgi:hypothetical protein